MFNIEYYVDERAVIHVPLKIDAQQAREVRKLPVHEYSELHGGRLSVHVMSWGGGCNLPRDEF